MQAQVLTMSAKYQRPERAHPPPIKSSNMGRARKCSGTRIKPTNPANKTPVNSKYISAKRAAESVVEGQSDATKKEDEKDLAEQTDRATDNLHGAAAVPAFLDSASASRKVKRGAFLADPLDGRRLIRAADQGGNRPQNRSGHEAKNGGKHPPLGAALLRSVP